MDNDIKMKYCRLLDDESDQYLFYLDDEIQIAMGGRYLVPRCTCGANERGIACKVSSIRTLKWASPDVWFQHIFWMLDQLASKGPQRLKDQTLELSVDGSSIQDKDPLDIINNVTLEKVAGSLDWELHEGPIPEDEDIEDEIAEMLSVFEPSEALPSEFKNPQGLILSERSRKYREFVESVTEIFTEHASKNLGLLSRLQATIDSDFQAHVFFEKISNRVVRTFQALDEYIAHGSTAAHSEAHDVPTCARKLKSLVKAIDDYYQQQTLNGLGSNELDLRAAAVLISTLDGVVRRNQDAYANITWDAVPPDDAEENNLFVCLIGAPVEGENLFVLDTLRRLPSEGMLRNHWESLSEMKAGLNARWTPKAFLDVFHAITSDSRKRSLSGSEGSSAKRTMQ
jgi:hypothetical protein